MKISKIDKKDIIKFSNLAQEVIINTPYYNKLAKENEIKKYNQENSKIRLNDPMFLDIAAKGKNKIEGFCSGYYYAGTFWIDWIGVSKKSRKKGLATQILNFLESYLLNYGVHKIWFDTRTDNKESNSLFKKLRYKKIVLLKNHWYNQDFYLWYKLIGAQIKNR